MKLLLADERCNNLLQDTIALLLFLKQNKSQLCQLKVEVSKDIKQHSLVLPNSCIKGTDDIYEFFAKYIGLGQNTTQARPDPEQAAILGNRPHKMGSIDDNDDLSSYYKSAIDAGDEQYEKPNFQQKAQSSRQQPPLQKSAPQPPAQQQQQTRQQAPARPKAPLIQPDSDDEMDVHDLLADTLKRGGTI